MDKLETRIQFLKVALMVVAFLFGIYFASSVMRDLDTIKFLLYK